MEVRNVLVNLGPDTPPNVLSCAVSIAERFRARITGIGAAEPLAAFLEGNAGAAAYEKARKDIDEALTLSKLDFEARVPRHLIANWLSAIQDPTAALRRDAVGTDIVVTASRSPGGDNTHPDIGELVMTIGHPVMVLSEQAAARVGTRVMIAWKDVREARRAVADALPFLKAADMVRIVTVDEGRYSAERIGLDHILGWLQAHDVVATGEVLPMVDGIASNAILNAAAALDADLIVAGAYGHSRLREWILGGMTRDLLSADRVSLFLSN